MDVPDEPSQKLAYRLGLSDQRSFTKVLRITSKSTVRKDGCMMHVMERAQIINNIVDLEDISVESSHN
jgi:hypothetical protein